MARIRTIKPEFPQSESMGRVSREARLCFVLLWTIADDAGRLRGNSRMLASLLYPYDDDAPSLIGAWLDELESEGCIARYTAGGSTYMQVTNWTDHQKIDKPSQSKLPEFDGASRGLANVREVSSEDLGPSTKDLVPRTRKEAPAARTRRPEKPPEVSVAELVEAGFDGSVAAEFIAHKAAAKAPLTQRAWADHCGEAAKAGWTPQQAAEKVMAKSWKGFEAKYVANERSPPPAASRHAGFDTKDYREGVTDDGYLA